MHSDAELFGNIRQSLYTAVVGDVMDTMVLRNQYLPPGLNAVQEGAMVLGRAKMDDRLPQLIFETCAAQNPAEIVDLLEVRHGLEIQSAALAAINKKNALPATADGTAAS